MYREILRLDILTIDEIKKDNATCGNFTENISFIKKIRTIYKEALKYFVSSQFFQTCTCLMLVFAKSKAEKKVRYFFHSSSSSNLQILLQRVNSHKNELKIIVDKTRFNYLPALIIACLLQCQFQSHHIVNT